MDNNSFGVVMQHMLDSVYSEIFALQRGMILIPAISLDLKKTLDKAQTDEKVTEEYKTEDNAAHFVITGYRHKSGGKYVYKVTDIKCNDKELRGLDCVI